MKGFNVVLAVLIFILALTSAVFSFFLFEKRARLVYGYGTLGENIEKIARTIDAKSGTSLAKEVNKASLGHEKSKDLKNLMPQLVSTAEQVIGARDTLAGALHKVSVLLENSIAPDQFEKVESHKNASQKIVAHTSAYRKRVDTIFSRLQTTARNLGVSLQVRDLKNNSAYATAYGRFDSRVNFWINRNKIFMQRIRNIASQLGVNSLALSDKSYADDLNKTVAAARKNVQDKNKYYANWQNAERTIKNLNQVIKNKDAQITRLNKEKQKKELEIKRLNRVLGLEEPRQPMLDGSEESMQLIKKQQKGKVIEVDNKFGFVVVSLGKNTRVQEQFGNRVNNVDPQIPQGVILTVARDMPSGDAEFITQLKLVRLDDNCSIAEPMDNQSGKRIRVGDLVYLADDEVARLTKERK